MLALPTVLAASLGTWVRKFFQHFKYVSKVYVAILCCNYAEPLIPDASDFAGSAGLSIGLHRVADCRDGNGRVSVSANRVLAQCEVQQRKTDVGDHLGPHVVLLKEGPLWDQEVQQKVKRSCHIYSVLVHH